MCVWEFALIVPNDDTVEPILTTCIERFPSLITFVRRLKIVAFGVLSQTVETVVKPSSWDYEFPFFSDNNIAALLIIPLSSYL